MDDFHRHNLLYTEEERLAAPPPPQWQNQYKGCQGRLVGGRWRPKERAQKHTFKKLKRRWIGWATGLGLPHYAACDAWEYRLIAMMVAYFYGHPTSHEEKREMRQHIGEVRRGERAICARPEFVRNLLRSCMAFRVRATPALPEAAHTSYLAKWVEEDRLGPFLWSFLR